MLQVESAPEIGPNDDLDDVDEPTRRRRTRPRDPELRAIDDVIGVFADLSPEVVARVLWYLNDRYQRIDARAMDREG